MSTLCTNKLENSTSETVKEVCNILNEAAKICSKKSNPRKNQPKLQVWNETIKNKLLANKAALREWKNNGRPVSETNIYVMTKKQTRQDYRNAVRVEMARRRLKDRDEIMNGKFTDTKLFHKLINKQRKTKLQVIEDINVDNTTYTGDNILLGFKRHFQLLAEQNNNTSYDEQYHRIVEQEIPIISELVSKQINCSISVQEVQKAIQSINRRKSPDIFGLSIENILHAGSDIIPILHNI